MGSWVATSAFQRCALAVLEGIGKRRWGYPPRLMAPVVAQLGAFGALRWFLWNMQRYGRTVKIFGEVRAHLLCVAISLINNCEYCTCAYAYALELAYLQEHGRLFPLGERAISALCGLPPALIRHSLINATQLAGLHTDARWLDRTITLALCEDRQPTDPDDVRIVHLVHMFSRLNLIAIASGITPDEAPTPLNKDKALKLRYAALRATQTA
jgi:hypothetical protein